MPKTPRQKTNKYANLRRSEIRDPRKFIVLVVEGERTEKFYFQMIENKFSDLVKLEIIEPKEKKSNPKHLLKSAIIKNNYYKRATIEPDSFWIVCDTDNHSNLHSVFKEAKQNQINIAVSNPCFEVWLFLHLGKILIENDYVKFCDFNEEKILTVKKSKVIDKKLSQKICKALGEIRKKESKSGYEVYFSKITTAVLASEENLEQVKENNLLIGNKYIGQTYVGKLVKDILKQN